MRYIPLKHVAEILNCQSHFTAEIVQGYCTDSRLLKKGELFFALKGERVNGHDYIVEAKKRGAIAAVVSKEFQESIEDFPLLFVEDPLVALQELAQQILLQNHVRIVAITGSIGKTTTKEFIKTLLSKKFRVAASPGNSNSQVGMPLTILNHTTGEEDIIILEMGMTNVGQLSRLIQIATPEVAVITKVALVHACNFESLEDIALAKAEILSHPQTKVGILDQDLFNYTKIPLIGNCQKISFSTCLTYSDYSLDPFDKSLLISRLEKNQKISIGKLPIPGKHNLHNLLAAIAVARYFNVEWEIIKKAISELSLPERRLQFVSHLNVLFLNDSYNASELSVKAALEALPEPINQGRKIAVLGSMLELGKFSEECHRHVGEFALNHVDLMYCLGEECLPIFDIWKKNNRSVYFFTSRHDLVNQLRQDIRSSDVILLKGSRSKELWKVLEEI